METALRSNRCRGGFGPMKGRQADEEATRSNKAGHVKYSSQPLGSRTRHCLAAWGMAHAIRMHPGS